MTWIKKSVQIQYIYLGALNISTQIHVKLLWPSKSHLPGIFPRCVVHTLYQHSSTVLALHILTLVPVDRVLMTTFNLDVLSRQFGWSIQAEAPASNFPSEYLSNDCTATVWKVTQNEIIPSHGTHRRRSQTLALTLDHCWRVWRTFNAFPQT